jgi:hypothetical protein
MSRLNVDRIGGLTSGSGSPELAIDASGRFSFDAGTLYVDSTNDRIGIKTTTPTVSLDMGTATDAVILPKGSTAQRPSSPVQGMLRYNSQTGKVECYDATVAWADVGGGIPLMNDDTAGAVLRTRRKSGVDYDNDNVRNNDQYEAYWTHDLDSNYRLENATQWPFRYIINRGYTIAGYKSASPYKNGNRTTHPNDVTLSLGDVIDRSAAYIGGSHNGVNMFIYNCANAWLPAVTNTCSFSMITETNRGQNGNWNTTRARSYSGAWIDFLGNQWYTNSGRNRAYITSGNGNTDRHDLNTEVMSTEVGGSSSTVAHAEGEYFAWISGGGQFRFEFSTEAYTSWSNYSPQTACDGYNKHMRTRLGMFYASENTNTSRGVTKRRDSDAAILRSGIEKPENGGEENLHSGMNRGYCISNYNGAQNNNSWIYFFYVDAIRFADSIITYRKGIPGSSSGVGREGGDMIGAGVQPRSFMTYTGSGYQAPYTAGTALADGTGAYGGFGSY